MENNIFLHKIKIERNSYSPDILVCMINYT